jgi:CxxC motif-containing protein (DUF1111 family)
MDPRSTQASRVETTTSDLVASFVLLVAAACMGCETPVAIQESPASRSATALDGLDADELRRFQRGAEEFAETETIVEGLGPFFNGSSCGHCHFEGGLGGGGTMRVTRVMCRGSDDELSAPASGPLLHVFSTRPDVAAPGVPSDCDAVLAERRTTNVLGAGLIEAIDDAQILDEEVAQQKSVAGRAAILTDLVSGRERVGRFGWKAQHATLEAFAADAYRGELGITNELFAEELVPNGDQSLLLAMDGVPDPEAGPGAVGALADFMRFSAAPASTSDDLPGLVTFRSIGCSSCHRESYTTEAGSSTIAGRELRLYSDLLLHDIGTSDGIPQEAALPSELRTPPLWGLGRASLFLHDGRASSIEAAVMAHAGQAGGARDAYAALTEPERLEVLHFLKSL